MTEDIGITYKRKLGTAPHYAPDDLDLPTDAYIAPLNIGTDGGSCLSQSECLN